MKWKVSNGSNDKDIERSSRHQFLVFGSMSFIGASLSVYIAQQGHTLIATEDAAVIEQNRMKWYRWSELSRMNIPLMFIDFTKELESELEKALKKLGATSMNGLHIIYIPTSLFEKGDTEDIDMLSSQLDSLHKLLFHVSVQSDIKVTVVLPVQAIHNIWIEMFIRLLASHRTIDTQSVRVRGVYGPWEDGVHNKSTSCWYIGDIVKKILLLSIRQDLCVDWMVDKCHGVHKGTDCQVTTYRTGLLQTIKWRQSYKEYLKLQTRNVTAGHYLDFTRQYLWGAKAPPHSASYFAEWFLSAKRHNTTDIVIFHDHLRLDFQQRTISYYPRTEFVRVSPLNRRILHDQRLYMMYEYLLEHWEIQYLVLTDIKDCVFPGNPVKTMSLVGDYLFIDNDSPFYLSVSDLPWLAQMTHICYDTSPFIQRTMDLYGCFDNGFMGGSRHVMLAALSRIVLLLDNADIKAVCDQVTANIVYHGYFYESVYAGYPLTSGFMTGIAGPQGVSVKHKPQEIKSET